MEKGHATALAKEKTKEQGLEPSRDGGGHNKCLIHPLYKADYPPRNGCPSCKAIFRRKQNERKLQ